MCFVCCVLCVGLGVYTHTVDMCAFERYQKKTTSLEATSNTDTDTHTQIPSVTNENRLCSIDRFISIKWNGDEHEKTAALMNNVFKLDDNSILCKYCSNYIVVDEGFDRLYRIFFIFVEKFELKLYEYIIISRNVDSIEWKYIINYPMVMNSM